MSEENLAANTAADDSYDDDAYFAQVAGSSSKDEGRHEPELVQEEAEESEGEVADKSESEKTEKADESQAEIDYRKRAEEFEQKARDLEQRIKSDEGRVSAYQRKYEEAQEQLKKIPKPEIESLQQLKADYPDIARAMEDMTQAQINAIKADFENRLTPLQEMQQRQAEEARLRQFQESVNVLSTQHPDWQEYDLEKNEPFKSWYDQQPEYIKELYGAETETAAKAADLISRYKTAHGQKTGDAAASHGNATSSKQARLERSRIPSTRSGAMSGGGYSDDEYFNRIANKTYSDNYQR